MLTLFLVPAHGQRTTPTSVPPPSGSSLQGEPATFESESAHYRVEVVAKGLEQPSAMIFLPDGRALVAERRSGRV
ncbi:MAG: hypothetical protein L0099_11980, partial [Acidobacteria bacterium]|nr:hypothetical protein [Acidobacteriota bacterium]